MFPTILLILIGVELAWPAVPTTLVLTGVDALEILRRGCTSWVCFG